MDIRIEKTVKCESVREGGAEVARLTLFSLALDDKYSKINGFYRELCDRVRKWFFESYAERAKEEFLLSDDRKKQYNFRRYEYFLDAEISYFDSENLCVLMILREGKRSAGKKIREKRISQCWRMSDETLLPLSAFANAKKVKKELGRGSKMPDGFYLFDGTAVCFWWDEETSSYREERIPQAPDLKGGAKAVKR